MIPLFQTATSDALAVCPLNFSFLRLFLELFFYIAQIPGPLSDDDSCNVLALVLPIEQCLFTVLTDFLAAKSGISSLPIPSPLLSPQQDMIFVHSNCSAMDKAIANIASVCLFKYFLQTRADCAFVAFAVRFRSCYERDRLCPPVCDGRNHH
jgi:hypothetical protein